MLLLPVICGRGDRRPPPDGGGCTNWPMGGWPEEDLGRDGSLGPQGDVGFCPLGSSLGAEMVGAASEDRGFTMLFLAEVGGLPVCWVNFAFSVAIAAAASGNMALMVDGSRPDWRFTFAPALG